MLYRNILAIKDEMSFMELGEQEWIPERWKQSISASLIFLTQNKTTALQLLELSASDTEEYIFSRIKMLIYIGVIFKDNILLEEGIKGLMTQVRRLDRWNNSKYENYLQFSLSHLLPDDIHQLVSDIYTTFRHNYYYLSHYRNAYTFLDTGTYSESFVRNSAELTSFYTVFNELEKKLEFEDLSTILFQNDLDKYIVVLCDLYIEAELNDDEDTCEHYERLFDKVKEVYPEYFEKRLEDPDSVTLDNYFSSKRDMKTFSLDIIKYNYQKFYEYLCQLVEKNLLDEFNKIMEEIKNNNEYFQILKERSSIPSKRKMKHQNIESFEPLE
jgi:hypothetical protein